MKKKEYHSLAARKKALLERTEAFEDELEEQLQQVGKETAKWAKIALLVGGGLWAGYEIIKFFSPQEEEEYDEEEYRTTRHYKRPSKFEEAKSQLMDTIKAELTMALVAMAKRKLLEFIQNLETAEEEENEDSEATA